MKLEWKNVEIYRLLKYPSAYNIIREVNEIILIYVDLMSWLIEFARGYENFFLFY